MEHRHWAMQPTQPHDATRLTYRAHLITQLSSDREIKLRHIIVGLQFCYISCCFVFFCCRFFVVWYPIRLKQVHNKQNGLFICAGKSAHGLSSQENIFASCLMFSPIPGTRQKCHAGLLSLDTEHFGLNPVEGVMSPQQAMESEKKGQGRAATAAAMEKVGTTPKRQNIWRLTKWAKLNQKVRGYMK